MKHLFDLTGKVALVTGSSRGIGRAIAEALAEAGARVVISSRNQQPCDAVAAAINQEHSEERAMAIAASISDRAAMQAMVDRVGEHWGQIDVLVCNAATNPYYGPLLDVSDAQFTKIMDNNVLANLRLIGMIAPGMRQRRDGAIVIVSSVGGMVGSAVIGAYNASKAADFQVVRNLAVELGADNIRVNAIAPGVVRTDFARALWENPAAAAAICARVPLGRLGDPDDIAGAAVFLAAAASRYVTGQAIVVDGGTVIASAL